MNLPIINTLTLLGFIHETHPDNGPINVVALEESKFDGIGIANRKSYIELTQVKPGEVVRLAVKVLEYSTQFDEVIHPQGIDRDQIAELIDEFIKAIIDTLQAEDYRTRTAALSIPKEMSQLFGRIGNITGFNWDQIEDLVQKMKLNKRSLNEK